MDTDNKEMREFDTGATRNASDDKFDYEGFLSPQVVTAFAAYMHKHRLQADGKMRDADNWQKGIPKKQYVKSLVRHTIDLWSVWRGNKRTCPDDGHELGLIELCCAVMFNVNGLLFELLREKDTDEVS